MNNDTPGEPDGEQLRRRVEFIAHDLNHLVTIILGYNELLLERTSETGLTAGPNRHDLEQIQRAANRVASLTRQLQDVRDGDCSFDRGSQYFNRSKARN